MQDAICPCQIQIPLHRSANLRTLDYKQTLTEVPIVRSSSTLIDNFASIIPPILNLIYERREKINDRKDHVTERA